ncbi:MAG: S41 family peptidase, partial [bacterium]
VQNIISLPGGGGIKLTVAQYLTPGDISIQNVGITPDIELLEVYLHEDKIKVFNHETPYFKEADLDGHFYSVYAPEETPKPDISIRYFKKYKTPEELREERKMERSDVFRSDREIEVAVEIIKETQGNQEKVMTVAKKQKNNQWETIVEKMKDIGIAWHPDDKKENTDSSKLKFFLKNSGKLKAGEKNTLKFVAEYPGKVTNLFGVMDTEIPFLNNVEIPFGSFEKKIEQDINIVLPDHMDWYKKEISVNLSNDKFESILKNKKIEIETVPLPRPEIEFSYYLKEVEGKKDGLLEPGEKMKLIVQMKNREKGKIKDGRVMLFNQNNNENVFIEKGAEKIKLKSGETKKVSFGFEISEPEEKKEEKKEKSVDISVNVYDYDTKFYSGFSVPMAKQPPPCNYKPEKSRVKLEKETPLYSNVTGKQQVASVAKEGFFEVTGNCGDMDRLSSGKWIHSDKTKKIPAGKKTLKKGETTPIYGIKMPEIRMDESPMTTDNENIKLDFSAEGEDLREIMVFVNKRKMFYHWVEDAEKKLDFSIPLKLENKINRIKVIAKNHDSEQKTDVMKIVFYPDGKKLQY